MKDEIKEILEELKEKNETYKECSENGIIENEYYKSHILLDYITNLQEELNATLKNYGNLVKEWKILQEENEFLKLSNPEMNMEHFRIVKENKRKIDNLRKENKRLNNIINDLEKWLKQSIKEREQYDKENNCEWQGYNFYIELLDKLKELKEKNDN